MTLEPEEPDTATRAWAISGRETEPQAMSTLPRDRHDLRILQSFRRIIRAVDIDSRHLDANYGVTGPQLTCLGALVELGPVTASQLARAVHLGASTVVGILDRLEKKGLVLRSRDQADRRLIMVETTAAGAELLANAPSPLHRTLADGLKRLSELEQTSIALALERVVALIEAQAIEAAPILETGPLGSADAGPPPPPAGRPELAPATDAKDGARGKDLRQ